MTQQETIKRLERYQSSTPSNWRKEAEARRKAQQDGWLQYSRKIAVKIALSMKEQNLTRQDIANRMNCSPQYISRLLKGEENLSLETICKLEKALGVSIMREALA